MTGATKGNPVGKFWDQVAYSRVVEWGRSFRFAGNYVMINELEGIGLRSYRKPAKQLSARHEARPHPR